MDRSEPSRAPGERVYGAHMSNVEPVAVPEALVAFHSDYPSSS
jgi:hypothetical protein